MAETNLKETKYKLVWVPFFSFLRFSTLSFHTYSYTNYHNLILARNPCIVNLWNKAWFPLYVNLQIKLIFFDIQESVYNSTNQSVVCRNRTANQKPEVLCAIKYKNKNSAKERIKQKIKSVHIGYRD